MDYIKGNRKSDQPEKRVVKPRYNEKNRNGVSQASTLTTNSIDIGKEAKEKLNSGNKSTLQNEKLGKKSIFYDSDWNPSGKPPNGYRNVSYNQDTFVRKFQLKPRLGALRDIKIPEEIFKSQ